MFPLRGCYNVAWTPLCGFYVTKYHFSHIGTRGGMGSCDNSVCDSLKKDQPLYSTVVAPFYAPRDHVSRSRFLHLLALLGSCSVWSSSWMQNGILLCFLFLTLHPGDFSSPSSCTVMMTPTREVHLDPLTPRAGQGLLAEELSPLCALHSFVQAQQRRFRPLSPHPAPAPAIV